MNLSPQVQIAITLLSAMNGERVKMEEMVSLMVKHGLHHRKSIATLRKLSKAGILNGYKGAGGGYSLAREPKGITLAQIIEAVEGPIFPVSVAVGPVSRVAAMFRTATEKASRITLADLQKGVA